VTDEHGGSTRSWPRSPAASDAGTTPAATTYQPGRPAHPRSHSGAATHGPSAAPPHTAGPRRLLRCPRPGPPAPPGTAAPPHPAPPAHPGSLPAINLTDRRQAPRPARSRGTATECRLPTGTTVAQQPEPRPQPVAQEPELRCPASTGTAHTGPHSCLGDISVTNDLQRRTGQDRHGPDLRFRVELRGFEPLTPSMRTRCATGLRYSPWNSGQPSKPSGPLVRSAAPKLCREVSRRRRGWRRRCTGRRAGR
jgi:hypothetical protein